MTKHTPGPWKLSIIPETDKEPERIIVHGGVNVVLSFTCRVIPGYENSHSDARLIAAAPELLEALHNVRNALALALNNGKFDGDESTDENDSRDEVMSALAGAADAIAKAEGEGLTP